MRAMARGMAGICFLTLVSTSAWAGLGRPVPVSPGGTREAIALAPSCPSFSWTWVPKARTYELVVHRIEVDGELRERSRRTVPRYLAVGRAELKVRIPGPALSWTPPLDRCLDPGASYAWLVRARWSGRAGHWSEPALFRVASDTGPVALEAEPGRRPTTSDSHETSEPPWPDPQSAQGRGEPGSNGDATPPAVTLGPVPAGPQPALTTVFAEHAANDTAHGAVVGVAWGQDTGFGVYGENRGRGNYGYLGGPSYGVEGRGNLAGGYFKDTTASGEAEVGHGNRGIEASGNEYGALFRNPAGGTVLRLTGDSEVSLAGGGVLQIGLSDFRLSADLDEIQTHRTDGTALNLHLNPHGGRLGIGTAAP